ncbi:helix-hairpin-helix domain-containing protein, partial [Chloroflexota bacterium]
RLIFALGIRHVGGETAEVLAGEFRSLDKLAQSSREELTNIPAIGPKIADSVRAFFRQEENKEIIGRLRRAGVNLEEKITSKPEELPLAGIEFIITGRLQTLSRREAESRVIAFGGKAGSNLTRETDYLVIGADPGSKLAKSREMGTKQLTEAEFLRLLGQVT